MSDITIIVPCYKEQPKDVEKAIHMYSQHCVFMNKSFEILLIENGSSLLSQDNFSSYDSVKVHNSIKKGLGGALKLGLRLSESPITIFMPADLAFDSSFINDSVKEIYENPNISVVLGSKFLKDSRVVRPKREKVVSWVYNKVLNPPVVSDYTGTKAWVTDEVRFLLEDCPSNGIEFEPQFIHAQLKAGLKIKEIPVIVNDMRKRGYIRWLRPFES